MIKKWLRYLREFDSLMVGINKEPTPICTSLTKEECLGDQIVPTLKQGEFPLNSLVMCLLIDGPKLVQKEASGGVSTKVEGLPWCIGDNFKRQRGRHIGRRITRKKPFVEVSM